MKKRILALLLAMTLLSGCGVNLTEPLTEEPAAEGEIIAYVPLDDRPDNWERVVYLAESMGYQLAMPEPDLFRTRLNGQPLNENGTQYGDRGALVQWVLDQEAAGCDRYVLFLDQLLSGGLVNSRAMAEHEDLTLPDGTVLTEMEAIDLLLTTLSADEENVVWLLDSVMRLAPTVGYQHWTLEEYNALREYGALGRPNLSGAELTLEKLESTYVLNQAGAVIDPAEYGLEEAEMEEYLSARSRKLELSDRVLTLLRQPGYEQFRFLMGIDDSSAEECIQKNEIAYFRSLLRPGDALLSGVDDLAFKAVTKLYLEEIEWGGATATVRYYGGMEHAAACAYDFQPLEKIMADHMDFFRLTPAEEGELTILVLTQPADSEKAEDYYGELIRDLNKCQEKQKPVILIDAGNGKYGTAFQDALTRDTKLGWLLSYSGFLDMAIVTGTALSHGVGRFAFLQSGTQTPATERAFARTLADSVLKDFGYKHVARPKLLDYIRSNGGNPDNFWTPEKNDIEDYTVQMAAAMNNATRPLIINFEQSNFITSLEPYAEAGWGGVKLGNYRFPWDRAFEIAMDISLGEFTEPHKSVLGIYYQ